MKAFTSFGDTTLTVPSALSSFCSPHFQILGNLDLVPEASLDLVPEASTSLFRERFDSSGSHESISLTVSAEQPVIVDTCQDFQPIATVVGQ